MGQRSERERGATNQRTRERYFRLHPLCVRCKAAGRVTVATELDHILALINGGTNEPSNRQGLCADCHKVKTAEDLGNEYTPKVQIGLDGWPVTGEGGGKVQRFGERTPPPSFPFLNPDNF